MRDSGVRFTAWCRLAIWVLLMGTPLPLHAQNSSNAAAAPTADQSEARIPYKSSSEEDSAGLGIRVLGGFVLVALIALASIYVLKRFFPSLYVHSAGGSRRIQVLEIRRLTPKLTLFLIDVDGGQLLLAQSGDHVVKLREATPTSGERPDAAGAP